MSLTSEVAERIAETQENIRIAAIAAQRLPKSVLLVAVSKKQSVERLQAAYHSGLRDFGENYVQGLQQHQALLSGPGQQDSPRWHFIGHLQSNKAKHLQGVHLVHSLDSLKLAHLLGKTAARANRTQACLININISQQESKSGIAPDELAEVLDSIAEIDGIDIQGLMCIPSPAEEARAAFSRLRIIRNRAQKNSDFDLRELSMGMSNSYREAIAEGATIVRVGTSIFGPRES